MFSREQKIRRGFHWLAVVLTAVLLAIGLILMTFDVGDL
jgi:cytochrome b561